MRCCACGGPAEQPITTPGAARVHEMHCRECQIEWQAQVWLITVLGGAVEVHDFRAWQNERKANVHPG